MQHIKKGVQNPHNDTVLVIVRANADMLCWACMSSAAERSGVQSTSATEAFDAQVTAAPTQDLHLDAAIMECSHIPWLLGLLLLSTAQRSSRC